MKRLITAAAAIAVAVAVGATAVAGAATPGQSLIELEAEWSEAMVDVDTTGVAEILAPDWTGQDTSGKTMTRQAYLENLNSGKLRVKSMTNHGLHVRIYGNVAVVQGADTEKSSYAGKDTSGEYTWMDVFVKDHGKWRAVASQVSRVTPNG